MGGGLGVAVKQKESSYLVSVMYKIISNTFKRPLVYKTRLNLRCTLCYICILNTLIRPLKY